MTIFRTRHQTAKHTAALRWMTAAMTKVLGKASVPLPHAMPFQHNIFHFRYLPVACKHCNGWLLIYNSSGFVGFLPRPRGKFTGRIPWITYISYFILYYILYISYYNAWCKAKKMYVPYELLRRGWKAHCVVAYREDMTSIHNQRRPESGILGIEYE